MNEIEKKIGNRLQKFVSNLKVMDNKMNYISIANKRQQYLQQCKQENIKIRDNFGPILITYIRQKPKSITISGNFKTDTDLIRYYFDRVQNVPMGCVVAISIQGEIHYGWSLCRTAKDRFNKVVCLNRALNRAINGSQFADEPIPHTVKSYLENMTKRANKYFKTEDCKNV